MNISGLLVGLGNPGLQYRGTRHNMGFMTVEALLDEIRRMPGGAVESLSGAKFRCLLWRCIFPGNADPWLVAMPQTFMNLSGDSVQPLMAWYKITSEHLLVIHDELDLPPGRIKLKKGGGIAGHNGLKSIVQRLGTQDFCRLRIGVGRPPDKNAVISWVLGHFPPQESALAEHSVKEAVDAVCYFTKYGPEKAANRYNGKKPSGAQEETA